MQIPVTIKHQYQTEIAVEVNGICNHADVDYTYEEEEISTHPDQQQSYYIIEVATCNRCGASKNAYAEEWL